MSGKSLGEQLIGAWVESLMATLSMTGPEAAARLAEFVAKRVAR
jgi:(methylthio)acryloyl-CoA hydratase